ncbi:hypothetical protein M0R72_15155 [Candidatus Pacearchaeota archaeon]|jgi:predicted RNA-binding Zn-ribbon protein involved in translation (DUF1610 family)|nr:hypothetical protein [Candidatus Pacearchaeota archaeon]
MSRVKELHDEIEGLRLQNENLKARKKDYFAFQCPACGEVTRGIVLHDVIFSSRTQPSFYCDCCKTEWCSEIWEHNPLDKFKKDGT